MLNLESLATSRREKGEYRSTLRSAHSSSTFSCPDGRVDVSKSKPFVDPRMRD